MGSIGKLLLLLVVATAPVRAGPGYINGTVTTANGKLLLGKQHKSSGGRDFTAFYGIPYGLSPVGERRFKDPERAPFPPTDDAAVIPFTTPMPICLQWRRYDDNANYLQGDEDCLRLNIYTPFFTPEQQPTTPNLHVLVMIHGGGFMYSASGRGGVEPLMDLGVIVVQIDYRLGVLGFLSTEDAELPGNLGMRDQVMALEWIRDNIGVFGGNKSEVTLFGYSAGSASALLHTLSPLSKGLFHRIIGQSGSPLNPWAQQHGARQKAMRLGSAVNCSTATSKALVKCLRMQDPKELVKATPMFYGWQQHPFSPFAPSVDRAHKHPFMPDEPYRLLKAKKAANVPMLLSTTTHEGLFTAGDFITDERLLRELDQNWTTIAPLLFHYNESVSEADKPTVAMKIREEYLKNASTAIASGTADQLIQMMGDRNFLVGVEQHARLQAAIGPVYFFSFAYRGSHSISQALTHSPTNYGVGHADDLEYILDVPWANISTPEDQAMRAEFFSMWYSFLNTSMPRLTSLSAWKPLQSNATNFEYVVIKGPREQVLVSTRQLGHNDFWAGLPFHENERMTSSSGALRSSFMFVVVALSTLLSLVQ